jgi:hypothetical protein
MYDVCMNNTTPTNHERSDMATSSTDLARARVVLHDLGRIAGITLEGAIPAVDIEGATGINGDYLEDLTDQVVVFIAELIQAFINAGSEREVTYENDALRNAIYEELRGWSSAYDKERRND